MTRTFLAESRVAPDGGLGLALAPALTPTGVTASPSFFHGFAVHPATLAQGLLVLADVTATRYFQYTPTSLRDPVLSAQGDRLRAECFSACNGVYARLDLLGSGLDGGDIGFGTTNVDINPAMRSALTKIRRTELLHMNVGDDGLTVSTLDRTESEHPVQMPDRWVRALGNVAHMHRPATAAFTLDRRQTRAFLGTLPHATSAGRTGWLVPDRTGARLSSRPTAGGVYVDGLQRLSALKRLLIHANGLTAYALGSGEAPSVFEVDLPGARLTLGLTEQAWRGFSGEGSLLGSLARPEVLDDADLVCALLSFEPRIDIPRLAADSGLTARRVTDALAVLAVSGRVGWDAHDESWFHRELPHDPSRVDKDNPRLVGARTIARSGSITARDDAYLVGGASGSQYRVQLGPDDGIDDSRCTCPWYLRHGTGRGPCKHVLAVYLSRGGVTTEGHDD
ncbi:SWIM zinc finger family protein [Gordonia hydrophobica]|uniref:SWIM zinc finger family protein n=1 Tax=Gordonia hydrophobica TaxID=40516 RepID=A0ABZ2U3H4_9ACTN|nr:SWIM zinc finger family protein [Gordonia hydrophobica]MBM7367461.1 hypothetical protein [Gordonia hydrophobica]